MTVVAIFGPTGSGKTDVAVLLAQTLKTGVINTDPAQAYDALPILSNKPTAQHDRIAPHHLVGIWPYSHEATVGEFSGLAHQKTDELVAAHGSAILCGGSGLYLLACVSNLELGTAGGMGLSAQQDPALARLRTTIEQTVSEMGTSAAHRQLALKDPDIAAKIHPNDTVRIVRALELLELGGERPSATGSIWDAPLRRHPTVLIHLAVDRELVRRRIDRRASEMFTSGALEEVAALDAQDPGSGKPTSVTFDKIHGIAEARKVLSGQLTVDEAIAQMATRSRQYAKRQDTWARRWTQMQSLSHDPEAPQDTVDVILRTIP